MLKRINETDPNQTILVSNSMTQSCTVEGLRENLLT